MIGRFLNFASKFAPKIDRGIGMINKTFRTIGQISPSVRQIGSTINNASGNRLANSDVGKKLMELQNKVEQGAKIGENFTNQLL
jgi:hypothetical protein